MGKINKYANIYKDGELVRHVNENGRLDNYTISEVEELVDKLANDKDENGNIKDQSALNNANSWLFGMYQKYGNPHESEILEMLKKNSERKTQKEEIEEKLKELDSELNESQTDNTAERVLDGSSEERNVEGDEPGVADSEQLQRPETIMDQYVDFEEVA